MFRKIRMLLFICLQLVSLSNYAMDGTSSCQTKWDDFLEHNILQNSYYSLIGLCGDEFRDQLQEIISTNEDHGYYDSRYYMFSSLDNIKGSVTAVYTQSVVKTAHIPDASIMNCEHTWPQSLGAVGIAKSDLHHLYPVLSHVNSRRSNHPFCNVEVVVTEESGSRLGEDREGTRCFEPSDEHKGDSARSMFYFAVRYGKQIDQEQEGYLREWYWEDVVSEKEMIRNNLIERFQNNRNPFIDYPEFIFFISDF